MPRTFGNRVHQAHGCPGLEGFEGNHVVFVRVGHGGFTVRELPSHLDRGNAITGTHILAFDKRSCRRIQILVYECFGFVLVLFLLTCTNEFICMQLDGSHTHV